MALLFVKCRGKGLIYDMENTIKKEKEMEVKADPDNFFDEYPIKVNIENQEPFVVFMRPLKVKEITILNRIAYLQAKDEADEQAAMMLVNLMVDTLNVTSEELPVGATPGLISYFIEYNFPKDKPPDPKTEKKKSGEDDISECFDFLLTQGHKYSDIMEYHIPQFNKFVNVASARMGTKRKPLSPEDAFKELGIPMRPRGPQDKN